MVKFHTSVFHNFSTHQCNFLNKYAIQNKVGKLQQSKYGLKQLPRTWFDKENKKHSIDKDKLIEQMQRIMVKNIT